MSTQRGEGKNIKTIQRKYETEEDKKNELLLGKKYQSYMQDKVRLVNQGYLSTYDFKVYSNLTGRFVYWLEVKKKTGSFWDWPTEIIPITKWTFARKNDTRCLMLIERQEAGYLYNISQILENGHGTEEEITRRVDQPEGSRKIVRFSTQYAKRIY